MIFPLATHKKHLMLVRHALQVHADRNKQKDPVTIAMKSLAKEQRASRKTRKGEREESSSEEDEQEVSGIYGGLQKYGLANVPNIHTQKTKKITDFTKHAQKATKKDKQYFADGGIMDYTPQWMGEKRFKNLNSDGITHAHWVAAWWSRAMSQIAAQGTTEKQIVSVEQLLTQFLNMNKVAIQHGTKTAWELDKQIWEESVEKAGRRDPTLNLSKLFTTIDENQVKSITNKNSKDSTPPSSEKWGGKGKGKGAGPSQYRDSGKSAGKHAARDSGTNSWNSWSNKGSGNTKSEKDKAPSGKGPGKQRKF